MRRLHFFGAVSNIVRTLIRMDHFQRKMLNVYGEGLCSLHPPQTSPHGKGIPLPRPYFRRLALFGRSICLPPSLGLAQGRIHREWGAIDPQTSACQTIEMPGRSKVGFITHFYHPVNYATVATFLKYNEIDQKSPIVNYRTSIWRSSWRWPARISPISLASAN